MSKIYTCYITAGMYKDFRTIEELQVIKKEQFDKLIREVEEYPIVLTEEQIIKQRLYQSKKVSAEEYYLDSLKAENGWAGIIYSLMKLRILMAKRQELNDDGTGIKVISDELADRLYNKISDSIGEITEIRTIDVTAKITVGK